MNYFCQNTSLGYITVVENNGNIVSVSFGKQVYEYEFGITCIIASFYKQLEEYSNGKRYVFDIPISLNVSDFDSRVYTLLKQIPYGTTVSYSYIAKELGSKNYSRAVGNACRKNPILIIIPCHRVINKNGDISKYVAGIDMKKKLLKIEHAIL